MNIKVYVIVTNPKKKNAKIFHMGTDIDSAQHWLTHCKEHDIDAILLAHDMQLNMSFWDTSRL